MFEKTLIVAIALVYTGNGAWMLAAPLPWYETVPGVTDTGAFNPHFVRDIGFAFLLSGAAAAHAALVTTERALWLAIGTAWPLLHALFHLVEWAVHGLPAASIVGAELVAVQLPVVLGCVIAVRTAGRRARPALARDETRGTASC